MRKNQRQSVYPAKSNINSTDLHLPVGAIAEHHDKSQGKQRNGYDKDISHPSFYKRQDKGTQKKEQSRVKKEITCV